MNTSELARSKQGTQEAEEQTSEKKARCTQGRMPAQRAGERRGTGKM